MIIRVLRGRVEPDRVASFHERARRAMADACPDRGCTWARMGRQVHADHSEEIVMVTAWRTMDALYDWVGGPDLLGSPLERDSGQLLTYFDVQHYESFESDEELEFDEPSELVYRPASGMNSAGG